MTAKAVTVALVQLTSRLLRNNCNHFVCRGIEIPDRVRIWIRKKGIDGVRGEHNFTCVSNKPHLLGFCIYLRSDNFVKLGLNYFKLIYLETVQNHK